MDQIEQIVKSHPEINPTLRKSETHGSKSNRTTDRGLRLLPQARRRYGRLPEVQEELILKMMAAIEAAGTSLSTTAEGLRRPPEKTRVSPQRSIQLQ